MKIHTNHAERYSGRTWLTTVAFGGNPAPVGPWRTREDAYTSLQRWIDRQGSEAGTLVAAHTIRVSEYATRTQARGGDIADQHSDGLLSSEGLWDFFAHAHRQGAGT
jgi:hypothetical protein